MEHCCEHKSKELEKIRKEESLVIWIALILNMSLFIIELVAGLKAHSSALLSDSLEMLGDAFVFAFTLYVINKGKKLSALISLTKGFIMLSFGILISIKVIYETFCSVIPEYQTMTLISLLALLANSICFFLLLKFRNSDINLHSTWLCSRNDIIANISVLVASYFVYLSNSIIPDIIVGTIITWIFLNTSFHIIKNSLHELKNNTYEHYITNEKHHIHEPNSISKKHHIHEH